MSFLPKPVDCNLRSRCHSVTDDGGSFFMHRVIRFLLEFQRRIVVRAGIAHIVSFWVLTQVAGVVLPYLDVVQDPVRSAVVAGVALFPVTVTVAWLFERPWSLLTTRRAAVEAVLIVAMTMLSVSWSLRHLPQTMNARTSIVILPFEHSGNALEQSVSRALAYELISLLSQTRSIDVVGFETGASPMLAGIGTVAIAKRVSVANVLSGAVYVSGDELRVDVTLAEADGGILWEATVEDSLEELFSVQEFIALSILAKLGAGDAGVPVQTIAASRCQMPADMDALQRYYTARYFIELRTDSEESRQQIREAIAVYQGLIEDYPTFAEAKSGLAWALMHQGVYDPKGAMPMPEREVRARTLAQQALADCPTLGEAKNILPNELDHENQWIGAHRQLEAFIEQEPQRTEYRQRFARHLRSAGLTERAQQVAESNYALNPLSPKAIKILANIYMPLRMDEAVELYDLAAELGSTGPNLARMQQGMLRCQEDLECMMENLPPPIAPFREQLRAIYAEPENESTQRSGLDLALSIHREAPQFLTNWLNASACRFDHLTPLFFELWEQNKAVGGYWHWPNVWGPRCGNVWSDPAFEDFVEEAGLVEYWREVGWPRMCRSIGDAIECGPAESTS